MAVHKVVEQEAVQLITQLTKQKASSGAKATSFADAMRQAQMTSQSQQIQLNQAFHGIQVSRGPTPALRSQWASEVQRKDRINKSLPARTRSAPESARLGDRPVETAQAAYDLTLDRPRTSRADTMAMQTTFMQGIKWKERDNDEEEG